MLKIYNYSTILLLLTYFVSTTALANLSMERSTFSDLPGWHNDNHIESLKAFITSCSRLDHKRDGELLHHSGVGGTVKIWKKLCLLANNIPKNNENAKKFFEENFLPNKIKGDGLFTGYYIIKLNGSLSKNKRYKYPVYSLPSKENLKYSRKQIENGALNNKANILLWVDDPIQLFFLHIQGSGVVTLPNGEDILIGFAGKNRHKYNSIGKYIIDKGWISKDKMSAIAIKDLLYKDIENSYKILQVNPSYIFFRKLTGEMPIGGAGVPLTSGYSLAIDKSYIPYGVPLWLNTELTHKKRNGSNATFQRLMISQDTGSAIKGKVRGDIFFGGGKQAELLASDQNSRGEYFILLPR